jgi:hypothetical protein
MSDDKATSQLELLSILNAYGGELYEPAIHDDLGEPDEEQAYEDVVGLPKIAADADIN